MKQLLTILPKRSGRDAGGRISVRHQGGRQKRFLREVDFKRDKNDIWGKVIGIEYDPNRNANVALVSYDDGEKRYILAPLGLKEGMKVISSPTAPHEVGNTLPFKEKKKVGYWSNFLLRRSEDLDQKHEQLWGKSGIWK